MYLFTYLLAGRSSSNVTWSKNLKNSEVLMSERA